MEGFLKTRSTAQRRIVVVHGKDEYFEDRIRRWWIESQPKRRLIEFPKGKKEFNQERARFFMPSILNVARSVLIPELPEGVDPKSLVEEFLELEDGSCLLLYLGVTEVTADAVNWYRRRSASRMGFIQLQIKGRYDRRKLKWAQEISNDLDLFLDDRARKYMLDWSFWDLGRYEGEMIKLSLMLGQSNKGQLIGINFLEQHWPEDDKTSDFARLFSAGMDNYFQALDVKYLESGANEQKSLLNRHLRLVEQIRLMLFLDSSKPVEDQLDGLRKLSKFPITEQQVRSMQRRTGVSDSDCLRFIAKSSEWTRRRFLIRH